MLKEVFCFICCLLPSIVIAQEDYSSWLYYKKGLINTKTGTGGGVSNPVGHIPVLVRLNNGNFDFSKALPLGADIRFTDTTGVHLPYEIEYWNGVADSSAIWVWIDSVKGNDSLYSFRMYYGKSGAADSSRSFAVFDTADGFMGAWHLSEDASGLGALSLYKDATYRGNSGADSVGSTGKAGCIGNGQQFNGSTDLVSTIHTPSAGASDWTVSAWVRTSSMSAGMVITNRRQVSEVSLSLHCGWWAGAAMSNGIAYFSNDGPGCEYGAMGTTNLTVTGDWHFLVGTRTASNTYQIYVDGALEGTNNSLTGSGCQGILANSSSLWEIGKGDAWTGCAWNGYLDEVRLAKVSRSADWIKLSYGIEKTGSSVITLSTEIANPVISRTWDGGGNDGKWSTAANWLGDQVPDSIDRVLFNATCTRSCTLDVNGKALSITFTSGYTGNFNFSSDTLRVWGLVDFSSNGTFTGGAGVLKLYGSQNITPKAGTTFPTIVRTGAGVTTFLSNGITANNLVISGGTVGLGSGLVHAISSISGPGNLDFGSSTLRINAPTINLSGLGGVTAGTGALEFTGSFLQTFTPKAAAIFPSILHSGTDTLRLSTNNLSAASFSQTGGTFDLNGCNVTTAGNFDITTGSKSFSNSGGRKITVGGNASFIGSSGSKINLNPASYCTLAVTGALNAVFASINYNVASVSTGHAASCDSLGPVTNWVFDAEDYSGWGHHRAIFINTTSSGSAISSDLSVFPALLRLTSTDFPFSECQKDSGKDIRFSLTNGAHLSFERESWDSAGGSAVLWVGIPVVKTNLKTQKFVMYWGKSTATDKSGGSSVFQTSNNFQGVWHLSEDLAGAAGSALYKDATANAITGNDYVSATGKTGVIGRGQEFSPASSDWIDLADFTSTNWNAITIEGWANLKSPLQTDERSIVRKENQFQLGINNPSTGNIRNLVKTNGTDGWTAANDQIVGLATGTWYYFAFTYDNAASVLKHFVNGAQQGSDKLVSGTITDNANRFSIGANTGGASLNLNAYIDEVRISNVARSANWLKFCYDNGKAGSQVVHYYIPVVSGLNDSVLVSAFQRDKDTGAINYMVQDPNTTPVSVSAQYKTASGGSWTSITTGSGNVGNVDTSATTGRQLRWRVQTEPGTGIEGSYIVRVIAGDGTYADTTQSGSFILDTKAPAGLANFRPTDSTMNSVRLSWTAATDVYFDHYEIYYGTDRAAVLGSTSSKWDNNNDAALGTAGAVATLISGLTANMRYYFKIYAKDHIGNTATVPDTSAGTFSQVSPAWSKTAYGAIYGGAMGDSVMYVAGGNGKITCVNIADGGAKWDAAPSAGGNPNRPSYGYYGGTYKVLYSAGSWVYGLRDNGNTKTDMFGQNLGSAAGTPYASPDDSTFVVASTNTLTRRKMADGSVMSGWPKTVTNISTAADPVVYGDMMYVAGTDGNVYKYGMDGTLQATCNVGAAVNQPLLENSGRLFITPNSAKLFCFSTSPLDTIWELNVTNANTGPCFKLPGYDTIWIAAGSTVQQVRDAGATGSVVWTYTAAGTVNSGPVCQGGTTLYFGANNGWYYAIDRTNHQVITNWPYRGAIGNANAGPWINEKLNKVVFGTDGGNIDAFTLW
jgi:hypothetical protein